MAGGRRFGAPDWGPDHLSLDAIVAYVDDELAAGPHERAQAHVACCPECHAEVVAQRQARAALRTADDPRLPSSLLRSLRSIPVEAELPPPPPGLGVTADGQFVLLRDVPPADGADRSGAPAGEARRGSSPAGGRFSWRARIGAVSGLAVGALAVGALTLPDPVLPPEPGVLGGAVLNVPAQGVPASARLDTERAAVPGDVAVGPVDGAAAGTSDGPSAGSSATSVSDAAVVLDARLRARLDDSPIAFHHRDR